MHYILVCTTHHVIDWQGLTFNVSGTMTLIVMRRLEKRRQIFCKIAVVNIRDGFL